MKKLFTLLFVLWASTAFAQAGSENKMNALSYTSTGVTFAQLTTLPPQINGTGVYCTDCTISTVCAPFGGGAHAELVASVWNCGNNAAIISTSTANAGAHHLFISPDSGSPTTTMDVTADVITVVNPNTAAGTVVFPFSGGDLVVGAQSGSVVNGRDQTAAFGVDTFYHLYAIGGGGQVAGVISSLAGPGTGPTLPTNYTSWAYLGTFLTDGSGNVLAMYGRGNQDYYKVNDTILLNGTATSSTNVPISTLVPSTASRYQVFFGAVGSATGLGSFFVDVALTSGTLTTATAFYAVRLESQVSTVNTGYTGWIDMPYIAGGFYYRWQDPNTLTMVPVGFSVQVQSYIVPNNSD